MKPDIYGLCAPSIGNGLKTRSKSMAKARDENFGSFLALPLKGNSHLVLSLVTGFSIGGCMVFDMNISMKQDAFGELVGISQQAVSDLLARGILSPDRPARVWLREYCSHLRETAAGRLAEGGLELATERALLAREQRIRIALENAQTRKELAPVSLMAEVLAKAGSRMGGIFDGIVPKLRRRNANLTAAELDLVAAEIAKARNYVASMSLADLDEPLDESNPYPDAAPANSRPG